MAKQPLAVAILLTIQLLALPATLPAADSPAGLQTPSIPLRDRLGVVHVNGKYALTKEDYLNEGADQILALGSRVIKVYLALDQGVPSRKAYAFKTQWPESKSLTELAQTEPFRKLFEKPFSTFIMTTFGPKADAGYWRKGMSAEEEAAEQKQFYDLTRHFLQHYKGTNKTFVLQNWEGDWAIQGGFDPKREPSAEECSAMVRWLNARQAGIDKARAEIKAEGVHVYHALEVNLVKDGMLKGKRAVVNRVLPSVNVDLVSYSAWEAQEDPELLRKALDYIASQAPGKSSFGKKCVYIGEFGLPENERGTKAVQRVVPPVVRVAKEWGCPYMVYWQLYCNEARRQPVRGNDDVKGFWLKKPDGSKAWAWEFLEEQFRSSKSDQ